MQHQNNKKKNINNKSNSNINSNSNSNNNNNNNDNMSEKKQINVTPQFFSDMFRSKSASPPVDLRVRRNNWRCAASPRIGSLASR